MPKVQALPVESEKPRLPRLARKGAVMLAGAAALVALAWIGATGIRARDEFRHSSQEAVRVAELRGKIGRLNESLTMSAEMVAATGESRWVDRYREAVPKLDAAIAGAMNIATPEIRAALSSTTIEARHDLAAMERRVFDLAAAGDLAGARALMGAPEYDYLQDVYASGTDIFGQQLTALADARTDAANDRTWLEVAGLAVGAALLGWAVVMVRGHARMREAMELVATAARTDELSGLPNRRHFFEALEQALAGSTPAGREHALLIIDLDGFKAVNDAHGHPAGDRLLRLVSDRLREIARAGDMLARLGGDEFALLLPLGTAGRVRARSEPTQVARRMVAAMAEPFDLGRGITVGVGASIGIAIGHAGHDTGTDLVHRADQALYRAKRDGRNCFRFFEPAAELPQTEIPVDLVA